MLQDATSTAAKEQISNQCSRPDGALHIVGVTQRRSRGVREASMMLIRTSKSTLRVALLVAVGLVFTLKQRHQNLSQLPQNPQYFRDISFPTQSKHFGANNHVDARYAPPLALSAAETRQSLRSLLSSFAQFMDAERLEFWIAHGALLGWHWNRKLLPWDTDIDVQVSEDTLKSLAVKNMSFHSSHGEIRRAYLLDINAFFNNTWTEDSANTIDARWIDTSNGKFIDITAVRPESPRRGNERMFCKDGHRYEVRCSS